MCHIFVVSILLIVVCFGCVVLFEVVAMHPTEPIAFKSALVDLFECGRFFGEGLNV